MFGFENRFCKTITTDFRQFKFIEEKAFLDTDGTWYLIPIGGSTDLASVPPAFWSVLPPFGEYALEAALHDCAYQNTLRKMTDNGSWIVANLSKDTCDNLFKRSMDMNKNITKEQKIILFEGVSLGGWHSFNEDRGLTK